MYKYKLFNGVLVMVMCVCEVNNPVDGGMATAMAVLVVVVL